MLLTTKDLEGLASSKLCHAGREELSKTPLFFMSFDTSTIRHFDIRHSTFDISTFRHFDISTFIQNVSNLEEEGAKLVENKK